MRVSASLSLCTVFAIAIGASNASAQMNADEIFNRLKAQAGSTGTVQAASGATTRGLSLSYGEPSTPAAAAAPSVVAVPAAPAPSVAAVPAAPSPSYTAVAPAAPIPAAVPEPAYTLQSPATLASVDVAAPAPVPSVTVAAPSYQPAAPAPQPSYVSESPAIETVTATPVAVRPSAASYTAVEENDRIDLRIYFEWNSASLKPEAITQLTELCAAIQRVGASGDNQFKIIGHTDKSGSDDYNLYLSNARAREVKRHLVEQCALPADALLAVGEGERQSSPSTPSNAPEERRVEIQFVS